MAKKHLTLFSSRLNAYKLLSASIVKYIVFPMIPKSDSDSLAEAEQRDLRPRKKARLPRLFTLSQDFLLKCSLNTSKS
ncbi:hypothetical protein LguiB_020893 [Lonicera macranthoides]